MTDRRGRRAGTCCAWKLVPRSSGWAVACDFSGAFRARRYFGSSGRPTHLCCPPRGRTFPHTVVESLAVGCPVIATAVGGVPEVVRNGENGLLVPPNDPSAFAAAISRFFADADLRARLSNAAPGSVAGSRRSRSSRDRGRARAGGFTMRKKLLMVGRSRYSLPLTPSLAQKFDALSEELDVRVLASSEEGAGRTRASDSYDPSGRVLSTARPSMRAAVSRRPRAPLISAGRRARAGRTGGWACVTGRRLARMRTKVIADIHGDPAAPARLYGSPSRKALAPLADALARYGLRKAMACERSPRTRRGSFASPAPSRPRSSPRSWISSRSSRPSRPHSRTPDRALRWRARALQGGGRACRGLAAGRPATSRCLSLSGRERNAA